MQPMVRLRQKLTERAAQVVTLDRFHVHDSTKLATIIYPAALLPDRVEELIVPDAHIHPRRCGGREDLIGLRRIQGKWLLDVGVNAGSKRSKSNRPMGVRRRG